jgi:hypothetical protein
LIKSIGKDPDEYSQLDVNYLAEKLRIKDTTRKLGNTDFEIQLIKKQAERLNAVALESCARK